MSKVLGDNLRKFIETNYHCGVNADMVGMELDLLIEAKNERDTLKVRIEELELCLEMKQLLVNELALDINNKNVSIGVIQGQLNKTGDKWIESISLNLELRGEIEQLEQTALLGEAMIWAINTTKIELEDGYSDEEIVELYQQLEKEGSNVE